MEREQFEALVKEAIGEMPRQFRERLENVVVMIDDEPSEEMLIDMGMDPDETLLGLYEGIPLTERGVEAPILPDRSFPACVSALLIPLCHLTAI